jgi:hypothetical protein
VKRLRKRLIWIFGVFAGLCGGWLAAGALNDSRIDIPRPIAPAAPATQPAR